MRTATEQDFNKVFFILYTFMILSLLCSQKEHLEFS